MDYQALGIGLASVLTAVAAILGGIYTGRNTRRTEDERALATHESFRLEREKAEELAAKSRIEAIVEDANAARKRLRGVDDELHECRTDRDRGWDLARYHFGLLATLAHLLNNIFQVEQDSTSPDTVVAIVRSMRKRVEVLQLPNTLEEPLDTVLRRERP